ncbi:MAG: hypothetical protein WBP41_19575, partial [Saprospiraceae bacterium]
SVRHANLPNVDKGNKSTFKNETFPNSLRTTHQDYIRKEIFVQKKIQHDGLDARNYTELVQSLFQDDFVRDTQGGLIDFIKSKFG